MDAAGHVIEANVYKEQIVEAGASGVWTFSFDAKLGNIEGSSTAAAFIKVIDSTNYFLIDMVQIDMTNIPVDWYRYELNFDMDGETGPYDGQILQFGFMNKASYYQGSGIYYDNVMFTQ